MALFFGKFFRYVILFAVLFNLIQFYLKWKSYTIAVKDFKNAAGKSIEDTPLNSVSKIISDLRGKYKERIPYDLQWVPLSGGGLQLRAQLLFADLTEYIAIIAAGSNTVGRSGFHWSNSTCTVLNGHVLRYSDALNGVVKESFASGQSFRHAQFESFIYEFKEGTHVVCYGRGFIPASSLWASAGAISNGDPIAIAKLFYVYSKMIYQNMALSTMDLFHHYKQKLPWKSEL